MSGAFAGEDDLQRGDAVSGAAPRLYERAASLLSEQIGAGLVPAGSFVTESLIAEQFGISRPPARRALAELEHRGLLRKAKGRGYEVVGGGAAVDVHPPQPDATVRLQSLPTRAITASAGRSRATSSDGSSSAASCARTRAPAGTPRP